MTKTITQHAIDWNAARYEKQFDFELSRSLLLEEICELFEAKTTVDKLDAIGDIIFVAIGVLWKLGLSDDEIKHIFYSRQLDTFDNIELHNYMCSVMEYFAPRISSSNGEWPIFELTMYSVFVIAINAARSLGFQEYLYEIVLCICKSNNTKSVVRTDSGVKANINKGSNYVPPTRDLMYIVNIVQMKGN